MGLWGLEWTAELGYLAWPSAHRVYRPALGQSIGHGHMDCGYGAVGGGVQA
jgi:hypothetical protein